MPIRRYLSLYNTNYLTEKLWVDGQIPEPYAIIKPIIYLSFLTCMKNMKKIMVWASTLIEPLLMILIALGVLGFLLSMYLPLFRMAERFLNQTAALLLNNPAPFPCSLASPDDVLENPGCDRDRFPADAE